MLHFKKVFKLLEAYFNGVREDEKEGQGDSLGTKGALSPKRQPFGPIQSHVFLTEKARKKGYDVLDKTVATQLAKKTRKELSAANFQLGCESKDIKGIMSAIKISKVGLPVQMPHDIRINFVKSFSSQMHTTPISDFVMPQSHFARQLQGRRSSDSKKRLEYKNLWILKPTGLNRGQGIHVVDSLKECKKLMLQYFFGREYQVGGQQTDSTIEDRKAEKDSNVRDRDDTTNTDDDTEKASALSNHRQSNQITRAQVKGRPKFVAPQAHSQPQSHLLKCT